MNKLTFALFFGNRGFFPGELIASARDEMIRTLQQCGYNYIIMDAEKTRYGAVETAAEGKQYAQFLAEHKGEFDGVILSLPNFGDENGAVAALRDANVPILIQAYRDDIGRMDFAHRRDSFCGKFSIMDYFYQAGIKYTVFAPHVCNPCDAEFAEHVDKFAAVCRVVKGMKRFTLGAIGARTTAFKTVRFDELTLQKYGITVEALDLSMVFERVNKYDNQDKLADKKAKLLRFSDCSYLNEDKILMLCKVGCVLDDIICEYNLDALALRCWDEFITQLNVAPCVLLGMLNDSGVTAACEMDVCNAVTMRALSLASDNAATCLDWNNNYGNNPDKCILFHCGPVPASLMKHDTGHVTEHLMFKKTYGEGTGCGTNEGRLDAFKMTYASAKTTDGKLYTYIGKGKLTDDPIEEGFFGCGGVAKIKNLQEVLMYVGKNGYRHHVSLTKGDVAEAVHEAFTNYLGYESENFSK